MSRILGVFAMATLSAALLIGCQQQQDAAGDAGAALTEAAGEAVEKTGEAAAEVAGDLAEGAQDAVEQLSGEAKEKYEEYAAALEEKKAELAGHKEKLAGMAPQDLLSGDGKQLKAQADALVDEIGGLEDKLKTLLSEAGTSG